MNKSEIVIRTEVWNTRTGHIVKAVARDNKGLLVGATNQTGNISVPVSLIGKK